MLNKIKDFFDTVKYRKKANTLELELTMLKEAIKTDLFEKFMSNAENEIELEKVRKENRHLKSVVKMLKEKD